MRTSKRALLPDPGRYWIAVAMECCCVVGVVISTAEVEGSLFSVTAWIFRLVAFGLIAQTLWGKRMAVLNAIRVALITCVAVGIIGGIGSIAIGYGMRSVDSALLALDLFFGAVAATVFLAGITEQIKWVRWNESSEVGKEDSVNAEEK